MRTAQTHSNRSRSGWKTLPFGCLLIAPALLFLYVLLRALGAYLIAGNSLEKGDAVVALGGGGEWRVNEAASLVKDHYGQILILTEPGILEPGGALASGVFREEAIAGGLSPYAIILTEGVQKTTHDEAEAVLALMGKHQYKSLIVVTDPFHTRRAQMIFQEVFAGSGKTVSMHPVPQHWYRSGNWFLTGAGWAATLREYAKIVGFSLGITGSLE